MHDVKIKARLISVKNTAHNYYNLQDNSRWWYTIVAKHLSKSYSGHPR